MKFPLSIIGSYDIFAIKINSMPAGFELRMSN